MKHPMTVRISESKILKSVEKPPKLVECEGKGDPDEHTQLVNDRLNYFNIDDASKFKIFAFTLIRPTMLWFNGLLDMGITSWTDFFERFSAYFISQNRRHVTEASISGTVQEKKESLRSYIDWFTQVIVKVNGGKGAFLCWIFENGLLRDHSSRSKIWRKKVKTIQVMLNMEESYILLEEKLSTRFENSTSAETHSICRNDIISTPPNSPRGKDLPRLCQHQFLEGGILTSLSRQGNISHWLIELLLLL